MPSPGRQRGGGKVERQREASRDRSKARAQGKARDKAAAEKKGKKQTSTSRIGMRSGKGRASPGPGLGYVGRDKGFFASSIDYEDRADVKAKPGASAGPKKMSEAEKKEGKTLRARRMKDKPVKTATKSQRQRMQKTVEKQRRKGLAKKESQKRQMKSDSSKTPGETKPKRTGLRSGGGTRLAPRIGGGPYKRTTLSQRIRDILA